MKFIYPTTKHKDLFNYYNDLSCHKNEFFARVSAGFNQDKMFEILKIKTEETKKEYSKYLNWEDRYLFRQSNELEKFLLETNWFSSSEIKESIEHENEHYQKIKELAYILEGFCCWLCLDSKNKSFYELSLKVIVTKPMSYENYKKISLAPKNPGYFDKALPFP